MEDLKYLTEAFQDLNILNEDTFDINADGLAELTSFYNDNDNDMADLETVIDPVAQTEEELQDSYIGKAILDCVICQSKIYKDPEEVIISEDGSLANVGEICPYCQSSDGYKVIGQVAEYCPHCDDEDVKVETDEAEITVDVDKKEDEDLNESLNDIVTIAVSFANEPDLKTTIETFNKKYNLTSNIKDIQNDVNKMIEFTGKKANLASLLRNEFADIVADASNYTDEDLVNEFLVEKTLKEDMQNISIETDKEKINISSEPKEEEKEEKEVESDDEMIAPLEPETEEEFKSENEEDEYSDVDIDEFEESDFDELGEKYLRRVYENVKSYKTTKGSTQGNKLKLEGLITFKSGKEAKTNFVFEAKSITKTGKLKFLGENKQFARGKQAFTLTGRADGKKLIAESLTYNYRAKNPETKESKRLYGTVSSSKLR